MENKIGFKLDEGKLRMDLIPPEALTALGEVLTLGSIKGYPDNNWKTIENAEERFLAATLRHLTEHMKGNKIDEESKLLHLKHILANVTFLIYFEEQKL
jgi:hypothetical protein